MFNHWATVPPPSQFWVLSEWERSKLQVDYGTMQIHFGGPSALSASLCFSSWMEGAGMVLTDRQTDWADGSHTTGFQLIPGFHCNSSNLHSLAQSSSYTKTHMAGKLAQVAVCPRHAARATYCHSPRTNTRQSTRTHVYLLHPAQTLYAYSDMKLILL